MLALHLIFTPLSHHPLNVELYLFHNNNLWSFLQNIIWWGDKKTLSLWTFSTHNKSGLITDQVCWKLKKEFLKSFDASSGVKCNISEALFLSPPCPGMIDGCWVLFYLSSSFSLLQSGQSPRICFRQEIWTSGNDFYINKLKRKFLVRNAAKTYACTIWSYSVHVSYRIKWIPLKHCLQKLIRKWLTVLHHNIWPFKPLASCENSQLLVSTKWIWTFKGMMNIWLVMLLQTSRWTECCFFLSCLLDYPKPKKGPLCALSMALCKGSQC